MNFPYPSSVYSIFLSHSHAPHKHNLFYFFFCSFFSTWAISICILLYSIASSSSVSHAYTDAKDNTVISTHFDSILEIFRYAFSFLSYFPLLLFASNIFRDYTLIRFSCIFIFFCDLCWLFTLEYRLNIYKAICKKKKKKRNEMGKKAILPSCDFSNANDLILLLLLWSFHQPGILLAQTLEDVFSYIAVCNIVYVYKHIRSLHTHIRLCTYPNIHIDLLLCTCVHSIVRVHFLYVSIYQRFSIFYIITHTLQTINVHKIMYLELDYFDFRYL